MTAAAILETLASRGAVLRSNGRKIRVIPSGALDGELRAEIAARRAELLELLEAAPLEVTSAPPATEAQALEAATAPGQTSNGYPLEWDAGEAYRATFRNPCRNPNRSSAQNTSEGQSQSAPGAVGELPPAMMERPGLELCPDGLWRAGGLIVPTKGTRAALKKYLSAKERGSEARRKDATGEYISNLAQMIEAIERHAGKRRGISATIECPICHQQTLRYAVSSYNGHKRGGCSNQCGSFVQ
jgi:hypothetical protein